MVFGCFQSVRPFFMFIFPFYLYIKRFLLFLQINIFTVERGSDKLCFILYIYENISIKY